MDSNTQINLVTESYNKRISILKSKAHDYASTTDVLDNFKNVGNIINISPEQQCLSLIAVKVARLGNLWGSNKKPNNEAISDSILDLINYGDLLYCLHQESQTNNNEVTELSKSHYTIKEGDRFSIKGFSQIFEIEKIENLKLILKTQHHKVKVEYNVSEFYKYIRSNEIKQEL